MELTASTAQCFGYCTTACRSPSKNMFVAPKRIRSLDLSFCFFWRTSSKTPTLERFFGLDLWISASGELSRCFPTKAKKQVHKGIEQYTHTYIYIYICVCVCVCKCTDVSYVYISLPFCHPVGHPPSPPPPSSPKAQNPKSPKAQKPKSTKAATFGSIHAASPP